MGRTNKNISEDLAGQSRDNYSIFDNFIEGCQIIGSDWRYLYINDAAAQQNRVKKENILGRTVMEVYPGIEKTELFSKFQKTMNERVPVSFENEFTFPDGNKAWFEAKIKPLPEGIFILSLDITQRKKAEEQLKESEDKFSKAFRNSPNAITITRLSDGRIIEGNESAYELFGYSYDEVIGKTTDELNIWANPDDRQRLVDGLASKGFIKNEEFVLQKKDKSLMYVNLSASLITIDNHKCFLSSFIDITDRKKAEEEIQFEKNRLDTILEASPAAVIIVEADGKLSYINSRAKQLYGVDIFGLDLTEAVTKVKAKRADGSEYSSGKSPTGRALKGETIHNEEVIMEQPNGTVIPILASTAPIYNSEGEIIAAVAIFDDITYRKKLEEELRQARDNLEKKVAERTAEIEQANESLKESELKYRTLAENSPDLIMRYDRDFRCIYINSKVLELQGKPSEFFIGKTMDEAGVPEEFAELWSSSYRKVLETGKPDSLEYKYPTLNGKLSFETVAVPEFNERGEVEYILSITRDTTERKKIEEELREAINELERSNKELQSFAYITSHDLQEPLRSIASYAQLIERRYKGQLDSDADDFLDYMVGGATRLQAMIKGLLDYSRVGTKGDGFKDFSAEEALKYALAGLESSISKCNVDVTYDPLPVIHADESQITRVFQNLIGNALKFRKKDVQPKVHIKAREEEDEYIFSVQDNGIGIEKQYTDRIFEVFKRLHNIGEYQGAGIGLAIVKRIIERHGGRIWVESDFGVGSTFYFTIPIRE